MSDLRAIDKTNIWHPFTSLTEASEPILITHAEGIYLYSEDGRKIVDGISSWWVNLHGHANPEIAKAVADQAAKLEHVIFAGFTHEPAITLSQNLLSVLPPAFSKIFFSDNGSTAVEVALKMAIQYWYNKGEAKRKIIAIEGAYHGDTFGSMSVGDRTVFSKPFLPYLFDVEFISFPESGKEENVLEQFKKIVHQGNVAAFIYEPIIQAAAGMRIYSSQLLNTVIEYAKANEIICIADEVFTGFGRTGKFFASDHMTSKPDLMALSKGLTGGTMAMGVTAVSTKIIAEFLYNDFNKTFFHGHSFTANPIACAAANASFNLLIDPVCQENINKISISHKLFAQELEGDQSIKEARSIGTILAIELKTRENSSYSNEIRKTIYDYFIKKNILLRPLGNTFYIAAPYCITHEELEYLYKHIRSFLRFNQI